MPIDYAPIAVDLPDLSDLVDGLRAGQDACEAFFNDQLAQWEQMSDQLLVSLAAGADRAADHDSRLEQILGLLEQFQKAWSDEHNSLGARQDTLREEEWNHRRRELENELDALRRRAAECEEALAQQKQEQAQQETAWGGELASIRGLLEDLLQRAREPERLDQAAQGSHDAQPSQPISAPTKTGEPPSADPVLDSVLAQFEMLQRDVARRRSHRR